MGTMLSSGTGSRTYQRHDRVADRLAQRLGMLASSARQVLVGQLNYRVAAVIGAFNDTNELERRERWLLPIRSALESVAEEPLSRALILKAQEADAAEDVCESAFLNDPCPLNRDAWLRALDQQAVTTMALRMALIRDRREQVA